MKQPAFLLAGGFAILLISYLAAYSVLRKTDCLEILDFGTGKPFLKLKGPAKLGRSFEIIYYPLMRLEWNHPSLHELLDSN